MSAYPQLEIGLGRWDADNYAIELRFSEPDSDADVRLVRHGPAHAQFSITSLGTPGTDYIAHGRRLGEILFSDPGVQNLFTQARAIALTKKQPLRLRLLIDQRTPELQSYPWETLRYPQDDSSLLTNENILFSRYVSSPDVRPVRLRQRRSELRALIVIANPRDISKYGFAPIDVVSELERCRSSLGSSIATTALASNGTSTLDNLIEHLRTGYDILYLICHGAVKERQPWLWLEDDTGHTKRVPGSEVVARLNELQQPPSLIVLASCQSAGDGDSRQDTTADMQVALGPRLAEVGIPAVVAMQGAISIQTINRFMPRFFKELAGDGLVDRAIAVARGAVRDEPDCWMPVLFMRLKTGRIWSLGHKTLEREWWDTLIRRINAGKCTPILGPGLIEFLLGSTRDIARRWAETYRYPMALADWEDLPQVAQYLATNRDPSFPREELVEYLIEQILQRHNDDLPEPLRLKAAQYSSDALLEEEKNELLDLLIEAVGTRRRARDPDEPHKVLAHLPFPVYLTTNPDNLLASALAEAGREAKVEMYPWNKRLERILALREDGDVPPSVSDPAMTQQIGRRSDKPLVYHLFGRIREPHSVVLTEDQYFDYLIGVTRSSKAIPTVVRAKLTSTMLLFLGFQMDDWNFRVFFRSIMDMEGGGLRDDYKHVAVQIDPEEGRIQDPDSARRYLERYFGQADIDIYWGSVEDFARALQQHLAAATPAPPVPVQGSAP